MIVCVDFEGWSENRVLIAVVGVECLSESKVLFYTVAFGYSYAVQVVPQYYSILICYYYLRLLQYWLLEGCPVSVIHFATYFG